MIRPDKQFTQEEAHLLDLCLVCHAEHGGGNNSTFTCRSVSSTGTDTYSAIAAAVGSLKGPKHGGANRAVLNQFEEIKAHVRDWKDEDEVQNYIRRILSGEAGDHSGLVYGMGHAVYTLSDPRTVILKSAARKLAQQRGMLDELELMETIERVTPRVFEEITGKRKIMRECGYVLRPGLSDAEHLARPVHSALCHCANHGLVRPSHGRGAHRRPHLSPGV